MKLRRKLFDYESVKALKSESQFKRAWDRNASDHTTVNDAMIAAGRGHWRNAETENAAKAGDPLALASGALSDETAALGYRAESFFGQPPYMVHGKIRMTRKKNPRYGKLSVFDKHRKKIALQTLKYSDVGARIMGGMTKEEARAFLRAKGIRYKENPRVKTSGEDRDAAYELEVYALSDPDLLRQQLTPIRLNLLRKFAAGKYDALKAPKLWEYLAENAAQKYVKEHGGGLWFNVFTPETRRYAAKQMASAFDQEMRAGKWDHLITGGVHATRLAALRGAKSNPAPIDFSKFKVTVWWDHDRLHIAIVDTATEQHTFAEWWDDDARSMFEDGFFDRRNLRDSVLGYAAQMGMLKKRRKKNPAPAYVIVAQVSGKRLTYDAIRRRFSDNSKPSLYATALAAQKRGLALLKAHPKLGRYKITVQPATDKERGDVFGARPRRNPKGRNSKGGTGKTPYQRMLEALIPMDHHETDLYVPATPKTREIIEQLKTDGWIISDKVFIDNIDKRSWIELPFYYDPAWEKTPRRNPKGRAWRKNPRGHGFNVGDTVQYRAEFLRSTGMYTGKIPFARGTVTEIKEFGGQGRALITVDWNDPEIPQRILSVNLEKTRPKK